MTVAGTVYGSTTRANMRPQPKAGFSDFRLNKLLSVSPICRKNAPYPFFRWTVSSITSSAAQGCLPLLLVWEDELREDSRGEKESCTEDRERGDEGKSSEYEEASEFNDMVLG